MGLPSHRRTFSSSLLAVVAALLVSGTVVGQDPPKDKTDKFLGKSAAQRKAATGEVTTMAATAGFQDSVVISGLTNPTAVRFAPDGRVFVAEKSGIIKSFPSLSNTTPTVVADLKTNVHNFWDRGLLGFAIDPQFPARPYLYALYTYDAVPGGTAPRWGTTSTVSDACPNPPGATADGCVVQGRLSKLTLGAGGTGPATEQVLIQDWCQQYPSHSVGALAFGADGALYATGGDGASFNFVDYGQRGDPVNPCGDPPGGIGATLTPPTAEGGALRSQDLRTSGDPASLDGTVIRIDPDTGLGLSTNPLASSTDANVRRVIATGLRNPFRMTIRPGTSEVWLGDVGWSTFEEINRIENPTATPRNFGWPCYEGAGRHSGYDSADLTICENLYAASSGTHAAPYFPYRHGARVVANEACPTNAGSSIAGLAFYGNSGSYPSQYHGALFFADYSRDCIWAMRRGSNGLPDPSQIETFISAAANPVDLVIGPNGDLFYVNFAGEIRRITYVGANQPPTASFTATPSSGAAPLSVSFDAGTSSDPEGGALTYSWDLDGNGTFGDATGVTATRTYQTPATVVVGLRVTDPQGATAQTTRTINASNTPPVPTISTPTTSTKWNVGTNLSFSGSATDAQEGTLPASRLSWTVILHHCTAGGSCHTHPVQTFPGVASGSFSAPDHEYPSHLEIQLTATDSHGGSASTSVVVHPNTVALTFASNPTGLSLTVGSETAVAPYTRTVIVGSTNSISAPSPQTMGGASYGFASWSDGGARSHDVIAGSIPTTYTATFTQTQAVTADVSIVKTAVATTAKSIQFTLVVRNDGPASAGGVTVTDTLPSQLRLAGTAPAGCTYVTSTRRLSCSLGTMASGTAATIGFSASVASGNPKQVDNTATVSTSTTDPNTANNSSTVRVKLR